MMLQPWDGMEDPFISLRQGTNKQQGDFERFNLGNGGRIVKGVINKRLGLLLWWYSMWALRWGEEEDGCKSVFFCHQKKYRSNIWNNLQVMTKSWYETCSEHQIVPVYIRLKKIFEEFMKTLIYLFIFHWTLLILWEKNADIFWVV